MGTIVVGVDGSAASWDALSWAVREAVLRDADLEIVSSWLLPPAANFYMAPNAELEGVAKAVLDEAQERVHGQLRADEDLAVRTRAVNGATAPALLDASEHAELLVVGSRGHGEFAGMLLGSVSLHCASHANCPVVIVRPADDRAAET